MAPIQDLMGAQIGLLSNCTTAFLKNSASKPYDFGTIDTSRISCRARLIRNGYLIVFICLRFVDLFYPCLYSLLKRRCKGDVVITSKIDSLRCDYLQLPGTTRFAQK